MGPGCWGLFQDGWGPGHYITNTFLLLCSKLQSFSALTGLREKVERIKNQIEKTKWFVMEAVCMCVSVGVMQRDESGFLLVMEAVWEGGTEEWVWVSQRRKQWRMIAKTEGKADRMG